MRIPRFFGPPFPAGVRNILMGGRVLFAVADHMAASNANRKNRRRTMANRDLASWPPSRSLYPSGRDPLTSFHRQIDRLFDDFFAPMAEATTAGDLWPSVDVYETDQAYKVTAELPGLEQKDVELKLRDNTLSITGEKRSEHKEGVGGRTYSERSYGRFQRTISRDAEVDADKVQATFKNGVLAVALPKNPAAKDKTRRIEVKAR
ncbi:Hsp20/alpha crystallin family protein [Mesorhizobium sp. M1340]|uniref:Hsp20/alpha crystallin family protein n=1 Tax=unclassified Mesorhizobium TaxID=325217 RepID=UPI00333C712C